jgi:hypothetical protein
VISARVVGHEARRPIKPLERMTLLLEVGTPTQMGRLQSSRPPFCCLAWLDVEPQSTTLNPYFEGLCSGIQ